MAKAKKYNRVARVMYTQMMRNLSTSTWRFEADGRRSLPGCVIASPTRPGEHSDQDYVNHWTRDAALVTDQAIEWTGHKATKRKILVDYMNFERITQVNAQREGRPGHACFHIDGALRPWGIQNDGPALRVLTITKHMYLLRASERALASEVIYDDLTHLSRSVNEYTTDLWEETHGYHLFTDMAMASAFNRAYAARVPDSLAVECGAARSAIGARFDRYRSADRYMATAFGDGRDLDISIVAGFLYSRIGWGGAVVARTAVALRDAFADAYQINDGSHPGVAIGRYPGDTYSGNNSQRPNVGHAWYLATILLGQYYYRAALDVRPNLPSEILYNQLADFGDSPREALIAAGDAQLDLALTYSEDLSMAEQFDQNTGEPTGVRDLAWSYAAFLSAVTEREYAVSL